MSQSLPIEPRNSVPQTLRGIEMDPISIATIRKNQTDQLRVAVQEYEGHLYTDIRTFTEYRESGQMGPTKKGCTIGPAKLGELIEALQRAQAEIARLQDNDYRGGDSVYEREGKHA